jgi:hypothetical protein
MRNQPFIGYHKGCGGLIRVKDWGADYHPRWLRYEAWCEECNGCDPNGHGSSKELVAGATEYFLAQPTREDAMSRAHALS